MDISTVYIALVFLAPVALGFTLLSGMASDLDWSGLASAKAKAKLTAKRKIVSNPTKDDVGCYA